VVHAAFDGSDIVSGQHDPRSLLARQVELAEVAPAEQFAAWQSKQRMFGETSSARLRTGTRRVAPSRVLSTASQA